MVPRSLDDFQVGTEEESNVLGKTNPFLVTADSEDEAEGPLSYPPFQNGGLESGLRISSANVGAEAGGAASGPSSLPILPRAEQEDGGTDLSRLKQG